MANPFADRGLPLHPALDLMTAFDTYRPSIDALLRRFEQNFSHRGAAKSQVLRELNVEVVVSPDEAIAGTRVPIDIPVAHLCARCDGTGQTGFFECDLCAGHGMDWTTSRIEARIPPRIREGDIVPVSLLHLGVRNLFLNLHIRVANA